MFYLQILILILDLIIDIGIKVKFPISVNGIFDNGNLNSRYQKLKSIFGFR